MGVWGLELGNLRGALREPIFRDPKPEALNSKPGHKGVWVRGAITGLGPHGDGLEVSSTTT